MLLFPLKGLKAWLSIACLFTAMLAFSLWGITLDPVPVQALADIPQCPVTWTDREFNTYFRHSGTASNTSQGTKAWDFITQGYPVVVYSTNPDDSTANILVSIYNDGGSSDDSRYLEMYPSGSTSPEYLFKANSLKGLITGSNLQVPSSTGKTIPWDWQEDSTPPYGSTFGITDLWDDSPSSSYILSEDSGACVLAIGGRIRIPQGIDVPYQSISDLDNKAPVVDHGWNVVDWIKEIWNWIVHIPELIADLFIPDIDTVSTITSDFTDFFTEKLGFLLWPFDFVSDVFDVMMGSGINSQFDDFANPYNWCSNSEWGVGSGVAPWSFGNLFGGGVSINPCMFQKTMPTVWVFATLVARATLVYAVVNFLLNAYRRHVK